MKIPGAIELKDQVIPEWAIKYVPGDVRLFELTAAQTLTLQPIGQSPALATMTAGVRYAEHNVWQDNNTLAGRTDVVTTSGGMVPLKVPDRFGISAVLVDGQLSDKPLAPGPGSHISIEWTDTSSRLATPELGQSGVEQFAVIHSLAPGAVIRGSDAVTFVSPDEFNARRPDIIRGVCPAVGPDTIVLAIDNTQSESPNQLATASPGNPATHWLAGITIAGLLIGVLLALQTLQPRHRTSLAIGAMGVVLLIANVLLTGLVLCITAITIWVVPGKPTVSRFSS